MGWKTIRKSWRGFNLAAQIRRGYSKRFGKYQVTYGLVTHQEKGNSFYGHVAFPKLENAIVAARKAGKPFHVYGAEVSQVDPVERKRLEEENNAVARELRQEYQRRMVRGGEEKSTTEAIFKIALRKTHEGKDAFRAGELVLAAKHDLKIRLLEEYSLEEIHGLQQLKEEGQRLPVVDHFIEQRKLASAAQLLKYAAKAHGNHDLQRHNRILERLPGILAEERKLQGTKPLRCLAVLGSLHYPIQPLHQKKLPHIYSNIKTINNPYALPKKGREIDHEILLETRPVQHGLHLMSNRIAGGKHIRTAYPEKTVLTQIIADEIGKMNFNSPKEQERFIDQIQQRIFRTTLSDFEAIAHEYQHSTKNLCEIMQEHFS